MAVYKEEEIRLSWASHNHFGENKQEDERTRKQLQNAKSRIVLLTRMDLLPLIHFVAQERYVEKKEKEEREYDQKEAAEYFASLADATLLACGMEPISEKFALDQLLLACFGKKEMLSFSEVLEITGEVF